MLAAHRSAVRAGGGDHYDEEILEAWSPPVDDGRVERFVEETFEAEPAAVAYVAVERAGDGDRVLGFSVVVPEEETLRAVYVDPEYARRELGTSLLRQAEWSAAHSGAERLELAASLNAEEFYRKQGYEVVESDTVALTDELEMECLRMQKRLPGPGL